MKARLSSTIWLLMFGMVAALFAVLSSRLSCRQEFGRRFVAGRRVRCPESTGRCCSLSACLGERSLPVFVPRS